MSGFKEFTKTDWDGMAGAAPFPDGGGPLVNYDLKVGSLDAVAVIDANGFYLQTLTADGIVVSEIYGSDSGDNSAAILRFVALAAVRTEFQTGELIDMGLAPVPA